MPQGSDKGVCASSGMRRKFSHGLWQRIKDEPLDIQPTVLFVGGKEAEEDHLLPYPHKGRHTFVPNCGGKQKPLPTITHNSRPDKTIMFAKVTSHMHINMILI